MAARYQSKGALLAAEDFAQVVGAEGACEVRDGALTQGLGDAIVPEVGNQVKPVPAPSPSG